MQEPCKNGWTDRGPVWGIDFWGLKKHRIRSGPNLPVVMERRSGMLPILLYVWLICIHQIAPRLLRPSLESLVGVCGCSPFAKKSLYEMTQMASDLVDRQTSCPGVVVMPPACLPVMQFAIVSASCDLLRTLLLISQFRLSLCHTSDPCLNSCLRIVVVLSITFWYPSLNPVVVHYCTNSEVRFRHCTIASHNWVQTWTP